MRLYKTTVGKYFAFFAMGAIFCVGLTLGIVSLGTVKKVKEKDTREYLAAMAKEAIYAYELRAETSFVYRDAKLLLNGEEVKNQPDILDHLKNISGAEYILFVKDISVSTTFLDEAGKRYVDLYPKEVWKNFVSAGEVYFDDHIDIQGERYMGCYVPIRSQVGTVIGMSFAGMPFYNVREMQKPLTKTMLWICGISIVLSIIVAILLVFRLMRMQKVITTYMEEIDRGEFSHKMPEWMINRTDEYGSMSRLLVTMSDSLDGKVQKDALTGLYNRSAAMHLLKQYFVDANTPGGETFTFAIGDIDFFKRVNDTYGHNCGDVVLKRVASVMQTEMKPYGFAARWGGEEFILVFRGKLAPSQRRLESIANIIRNNIICYDDFQIRITMTFGMIQYHSPNNLDYVISAADKLLYKGKENGRNQIVS